MSIAVPLPMQCVAVPSSVQCVAVPSSVQCVAVLSNGSRCTARCQRTWCDKHTKIFVPMYRKYKYLESKCVCLDEVRPDINTIEVSKCREAIAMANAAYQLRVMVAREGYHHSYRDHQHEQRIEYLESYIAWLHTRTIPNPVEDEKHSERHGSRVARAVDRKRCKPTRIVPMPCAGWGLDDVKSYVCNTINQHVYNTVHASKRLVQINSVIVLSYLLDEFASNGGIVKKVKWDTLDVISYTHRKLHALTVMGIAVPSYMFIQSVNLTNSEPHIDTSKFPEVCMCCAETRITKQGCHYQIDILNRDTPSIMIPVRERKFADTESVQILIDAEMIASMIAPHISPNAWSKAIISHMRLKYPGSRISHPECEDPAMTIAVATTMHLCSEYKMTLQLKQQCVDAAAATVMVDGKRVSVW